MENDNEELKKKIEESNEKEKVNNEENGVENKNSKSKKKAIIIVVAILCIIIIAIIVAIFIGNKNDIEENLENVSNQAEVEDNSIVENTNQNEIVESEVEYEKIEISTENKLLMAYYLSDFEDINSLNTKKLLSVIAKGINNGWIDLKGESSDEGKKYTESQIKSAVYSVFGLKLEENVSAENIEYKDGYYILSKSNNEEVPTIKNITSDVAAGTAYYGFDIYMKSGYIGRYEVAMSDDFVKSKMIVNEDVSTETATGTEQTEEVDEAETQENSSNTTDTTKTWKTAYKEQLQKFYKQYDNSESNQIATEYGIADIDKDGIPELLIRNYTCEADMIMYFFKYENGLVNQLGTLGSSHTAYYTMNNEKYLLGVNGHMGYETTFKVYISSNKIKTETISSKELGADEDYEEGDKYLEEVNWNDSSLIDNY